MLGWQLYCHPGAAVQLPPQPSSRSQTPRQTRVVECVFSLSFGSWREANLQRRGYTARFAHSSHLPLVCISQYGGADVPVCLGKSQPQWQTGICLPHRTLCSGLAPRDENCGLCLGHHGVAEDADRFDFHLDRVARFEKDRRFAGEAHARRGAGEDQVARR